MAKKRANGEGSIRRKPNDRWEGRYTQGIDPNTGSAIQKSVSAKTQTECRDKLARVIRDNRGIPVNHDGDYTAAEWCRLWFEPYSKPAIRYNTARGGRVQRFENPLEPSLSNGFIRRIHMALHGALQQAVKALSSGVDVKVLSSMLGHFSAGFTLDTYTHITNNMQRGAAEKIGGVMGPPRQNPPRSLPTRRRRAGVR